MGDVPIVMNRSSTNSPARAYTTGNLTFPLPLRSGGLGLAFSRSQRATSSISASTISASSTLRTISPLRKITPLPLPAAMPRSASRASPGPLTTQPSTLILTGVVLPFEPLLQLGDDLLQVDLQPAAGRAGDQLRLADAALRRLQDVERRRDLRHRVAEQADADRVADAVEQDRRQAARGLRDRVGRLARLGDADVRRVVGLLGVEPIRLDGGDARRSISATR